MKYKLKGFDRVLKKFQRRKNAFRKKKLVVLVGYTANYAIYVHEATNARFKAPGTGAKFLENSLRIHADACVALVKSALLREVDFHTALYFAGLRLQRESIKVTPIDTGNLRGSSFVRKVL